MIAGELVTATVHPQHRRLAVVKNPGVRKGWLVVRCEDGALVCWARLKGHATQALEELERLWSLGGSLQRKSVEAVRQALVGA